MEDRIKVVAALIFLCALTLSAEAEPSLLDTCRTGQDVFVLGLRQFGHAKIAAAVEKTIGA